MNSPRIIFMGTPEFAVASLNALVVQGYNIVAVITAPDKPAGRGMKVTESAVKKYAVEKGIKLLQPLKLKDPGFLNELRSLNADLQIVVAFRMLPELVWNMPGLGTINLHGSLLPDYRGAAPINWALINGETETGVTTFRLKQEIDTGDILMQESFPIGEDETAGEVHDRMMNIGAALLVRTVKGLAEGSLVPMPQEKLKHEHHHSTRDAPKINTETCRINWSMPIEQVHNMVRGLNPFPGAFTTLNEKMLKVYRTKKEKVIPEQTEGDLVTDGKSFLKFACSNGYIHLLEIQIEGKKKMEITEFLRGYRFNNEPSV